MSRVEELASITEGIAHSFDNRRNGLGALKQTVNEERNAARERMRTTAAARQEMAIALREQMTAERQALQVQSQRARETIVQDRLERSTEQRRSLAENAARRGAEVAAEMAQACVARLEMGASTRDHLQEEHAARRESVANLMEDMHRERLDMGAAQRKSLGDDRNRRTEEVQSFLSELRGDIQESSQALRAKLSNDRADQRASVREMMGELQSARHAVAEEQARGLAHHRAALQAEVSESIAGFQTARASLRSDLEEFGQHWKQFASLMRDKRTRPGSQEVEEQPIRPVVLTPVEGSKIRPPVGEEAESSLPALSVPADGPGRLAEVVFLSLKANPEGVKLADLESQFNVSRIEMAQVLRHLIEAEKVRKEDKLYYEA